jgi:MFS transporter, DHA3 family, macrolide efflux protein
MNQNLIRLLRNNANIRNLWLGETISNFGDFFYDVAIMWIVFVKTGSATQTGLLLVASFLPQMLVGPFMGTLADRVNKQRLMMGASLCQGILTGTLVLLIPFGWLRIWEIYVITVLLSIAQLCYAPARGGIFPDLVPKDELVTANSLFTSSQQLARIIGSVSGGTVMALIGPAPGIGLDALSFFLVGFFIRRLSCVSDGRDTPSSDRFSLLRDMKQGWLWLARQPVLLVLIGLGTVSNIALGPTNVLPPMFIKQALHGNAVALGGFDAAIGAGIFVGAIVLGTLSPKRIGLFFITGIGLQGIAMGVVGFAPSITVACFGNFVLGIAVILASLPMSTMFQVLVPREVRGRVSSISSMMFTLSIPITYGGIGVLGDVIGARLCYGLGAALFAVCIVVGLAVPKLRHLTVDTDPGRRTEYRAQSI